MSGSSLAPEIIPAETYQIDSDDYDSDQERDDLEDDEYDRLVEEAENGYSDEEMHAFTHQLKESGLVNFLREYLSPDETGRSRSLRKLLLGFGIIPPAGLRNSTVPNILLLGFAKVALSRILRRRERLAHLSSLQDALNLLRKSKNIIVLSGAGISTSCGIPDFRSSTGLYAQLQDEGRYELDDPQQMFDIRYFKEKPEVFYSFAKQIYPSNFVPSPCHRWIKMLEDKGVLLRNYTQNIDTLESLAGVTKVLQCHGSFKTASCLRCKTRVPGQTIEPYIMAQKIPFCGTCRQQRDAELEIKRAQKQAKKKSKGKAKASWDDEDEDETGEEDEWGGGEPGIIKPDITFFGQALDSEFDECLFKDREEVDLLVIIGTSLKVAPVSEVLTHIPHSVPQIYINLTPVHHVQPDICLLGDADSIVTYLSSELGWSVPPPAAVVHPPPLAEQSTEIHTNDHGGVVEKEQGNGHGSDVPAAQDDEIKLERATRVSIPPEEAEWISGQGEASHIHLLRRKGDKSPTPTPPPPSLTRYPNIPVLEPSSQSTPEPDLTELKGALAYDDTPAEAVQVGEAEDGYVSDADESASGSEDGDAAERIAKRQRKD
ncbi:NAD-dependent histone deacetylase SIR2 [Kwoniella heveanensis BCC8398]|uniref:NAD-dependent histone deacetylase SIR2 n=1 Tax=Kwoniella heveanensis BCC8398 TaxID=1296120 RepID=A0A1B9GH77_9TREE|nr:NAD-dependent histone deacetylase SIR2 [Kwoniella heveanensis BCC8398]